MINPQRLQRLLPTAKERKAMMFSRAFLTTEDPDEVQSFRCHVPHKRVKIWLFAVIPLNDMHDL